MIRSFGKTFSISLLVVFATALLFSCVPASSYLDTEEFERIRERCLQSLPASYSFAIRHSDCMPFRKDVTVNADGSTETRYGACLKAEK
ncbi:MAG TPA: hypothetical protein DCO86_00820 [Spirochaetaceae bacterium]|nr:hypothetical protein [Spirochaetaceae bacterium]